MELKEEPLKREGEVFVRRNHTRQHIAALVGRHTNKVQSMVLRYETLYIKDELPQEFPFLTLT